MSIRLSFDSIKKPEPKSFNMVYHAIFCVNGDKQLKQELLTAKTFYMCRGDYQQFNNIELDLLLSDVFALPIREILAILFTSKQTNMKNYVS